MEKYIENLIRGHFEYETEKITVSTRKIEADVTPLQDKDGSFVISCRDNKKIKLSVMTSDPRIRVSVEEYEGSLDEGLEVMYSVSTKGLDSGFVFKGDIYIISDAGEAQISVVIEVVRKHIESSAGPIKNLFHFTNLARSDFDEAVRVFYTKEFRDIFKNAEKAHMLKYRAFSAREMSYENVEEFLICVNKKTPVVYSFDRENITVLDLDNEGEGSFTIRKSGWGYTRLKLESDSDILSLSKDEINSYDFIGNSIDIHYTVRTEKLHRGINYASVRLRSSHTDITLPVFIRYRTADKAELDADYRQKKLRSELTECYVRFRIKDITANAWINESKELIDRMLYINMEDPLTRLYQAHSLIVSKRDREASILLEKIGSEFDTSKFAPDLKGYLIYLKAMNAKDDADIEDAVKSVWALYEGHRDKDFLLWILIYLDETVKRSPEREKELLIRQFERNSSSPLLLIEAYVMFSKEPSLLTKLENIEVRILYYAIKKGLFNKSLEERVITLVSRCRNFNSLLFKVLSEYFREFDDDDILTALCSYLIRNEKTDKEYGEYFREAVERELRITNLYEYYLYTLPENHTALLPRHVLLYFGLQNNLPPILTEYVFANMIVHESEVPDLLEECRMRLSDFAVKEIYDGHIDENLAVIYDYLDYFKGSEFGQMKQRFAVDNALADVAFIRLIRCRDRRMSSVVVIERQLAEEKVYTLKNGQAYVKICGNDYEIFFEDAYGNRMLRIENGYEEIPLLHTATAVRQIDSLSQDDTSLNVYLSLRGRNAFAVDSFNVVFVRRCLESGEIDDEFKDEIRMELFRYYFDEDMLRELDSLIDITDISALDMEDRSQIVRYMVIRDMTQRACQVISDYGISGTDAKTMVRLLSLFLSQNGASGPKDLIYMAYYVFNEGKYNEQILSYLIDFFDGTTRNLRRIWKAGEDFELDVRNIEEKIILQMLKTGSFIGEKDDIFFDYVKRGASGPIVSAYLSYNAYDYFVRERIPDKRIFPELLRLYEDDEINDVCLLALIRYYREREKDEKTLSILCECIRKMLEKNIIFDFFSAYSQYVEELKLYGDLSFVEYRSNPKNRVVLHYLLNDGNDDRMSYSKEEMTNIYGGIFSKRFVMFRGERLQYYITEESGGSENLTQSGVIEIEPDESADNTLRYCLLNEVILCNILEDYESMEGALKDYLKKRALLKDL
ncbi:MAG: DUF5717 family protein [Lachnospiraceae bacterium]|nr:DUF5717 family protein [Lachnospiraceae bacterium]